MNNIDQLILNLGLCTMDVDKASDIAFEDPAEFAMIRRTGLGASESSVILNVNPFKKWHELLAEKKSSDITPDELRVGNLVNVRKGRDLEPIIMAKFNERFQLPPEKQAQKPEAQMRLIETPCLTTNFDGVMDWEGMLIPVEFKYVSPYGEKYFNRAMQIGTLASGLPRPGFGRDMETRITESAKMNGIPVYYYTQVQQQLMFLNAPFGYLCCLFDKDWSIVVFKIYRDDFTQQSLHACGDRFWAQTKLEIPRG